MNESIPNQADQKALLQLRRDTYLFANQQRLAEQLAKIRQVMPLAPDQLLHPEVPAEYIVRLGKLRVSEFLPDGREVTRAVLQAGAALLTGNDLADGEDPPRDVYCLTRMVLMALGEAEVWFLPPGSLPQDP